MNNKLSPARGYAILLVCLMALLSVVTTMTVFAHPFAPQTIASPTAETDLPLTSPCASGEALPEWVVCLYGTVFEVDDTGAAVPLEGAQVFIEHNGVTVSGTTYLHPDEITPTYSIDMSPLEPAFFEPVTVTAAYGGETAVYQVILNPDFNTLSQRFDVPLTLDRGLLWGYVTDYISGTAVAGASVAATYGGSTISVTTQQRPYDPLPYYSFSSTDLDGLGVSSGELLTLTASYEGDADQVQNVVRPLTPQQFNFSTRWYCDDFEALPRGGGLTGLPRGGGLGGLPRGGGLGGLPRGGGLGGLPNVACIWGYVTVDRQPTAGVQVNLTISDTVYAGTTRQFSGETVPRYGIAVPSDVLTDGQLIDVTAVYSGATTSANVPAALNAGYSQQIDLQISGLNALGAFVNASLVDDLLLVDGNLWWLSRGGGLIKYDPANQAILEQLTTLDGFPSNDFRTVVADGSGRLWLGSDAGVTVYNPASGQQQTWGQSEGLFGIPLDLALAADGTLYIATTKGYSTLNTADGTITNETTASSGLSANALSVAYDGARNDIWFGTTNQGADRLDLDTSGWRNFQTPDLSSNTVNDIVLDGSGDVWFATENGVTHMVPGVIPAWEQFTTGSTAGFPNDTVRALDVTAGSVWIATAIGAGQYDLVSKTWTTYDFFDGLTDEDLLGVEAFTDSAVWFGSNGGGVMAYDGANWSTVSVGDAIISNNVQAVAHNSNDGTTWFGTAAGLSHYRPNLIPRWENFASFAALNSSSVQALTVSPDNVVWVGTDLGAAYYEGGVWTAFSTADGLVDDDVQTIAVDGAQVVWLGTAAGLTRYEDGVGVQNFTTLNSGLLSDDIRGVAFDGSGRVWVATYGGGVSVYDPDTTSWVSYGPADGLLNEFTQAVGVDDQYVWVGTVLGLNRFDLTTESWASFTTAEGLSGNNIQTIEMAPNGVVWLGTTNQATRYTPGGTPPFETFNNETGSVSVVGIAALADNQTVWFGSSTGAVEIAAPPQLADVAVSLTSESIALPGEPISYTVELVNQGRRDAPGTLVELVLWAQIGYQTAVPAPLGTSPPLWEIDVPVGVTQTIVVTAGVGEGLTAGTVFTTAAEATLTVPQAFIQNDKGEAALTTRDPDRADVRVTLYGPPLLPPGEDVVYTVQLDNNGGLPAEESQLVLHLPPELSYQSASVPPDDAENLVWEYGTLGIREVPVPLAVTVRVDAGVAAGVRLPVEAAVSTSTTESDGVNNTAVISVATTLEDAQTLILVAPERLTNRYGASTILDDLYRLAGHERVEGVVVDVLADPAVRAAYATWDADPGSIAKGNAVAGEIKRLIDQYTITYPSLRYLVFVGGDEIVPFYRVEDQSDVEWQEERYAVFVPNGTVKAALRQNYLLSDDFYADRTPTMVSSAFWRDGHPLYLPDFASGRLVETPAEIRAVIDSFLGNDGRITLDNPLVGSTVGDSFRPGLTADWDDYVCGELSAAGLGPLCRQGNRAFRDELLDPSSSYGGVWSSQHSNHFASGLVVSTDLRDFELGYSGTLFVTIGCHAGLNVLPPQVPEGQVDYDLMQAFAGQGGTAVATTAYGYASELGRSYSELLGSDLTDILLSDTADSLGEALVMAKQGYFTQVDGGSAVTGGVDYVDEKVLLPLTVYGLPMVGVDVGGSVARDEMGESDVACCMLHEEGNGTCNVQYNCEDIQITAEDGAFTVVRESFVNLSFNVHAAAEGTYYDYEGQVSERSGLPVQPSHHINVPTKLNNNEEIRGVLLRSASYTAQANFEPHITQLWPLSEDDFAYSRSGRADELIGFDRPLPYGLSIFRGVSADAAALNLVLGAFDADTNTEYLYDGLALEILYSDHEIVDEEAAVIVTDVSYTVDGQTRFYVQAAAGGDIAQMVGVCDDGVGQWTTVDLERTAGGWYGGCETAAVRTYVQVVDGGGQVTASVWRVPDVGQLRPFVVNLPLVKR